MITFVGDKHVSDVPDLNKTPLHSYGKSFNAVANGFGVRSQPDANMTYTPHRVTFHLNPERKGVSIVAWASDSLPPTSGETDENSEVVLQLLSNTEYHVLVSGNKCDYHIYPVDTYYNLECKW